MCSTSTCAKTRTIGGILLGPNLLSMYVFLVFLAQTYFPCTCFLSFQNIVQHFPTGSVLPCLWCCSQYSTTSKALHNRRQQMVDPTGPRRTRAPSWKTCWLPRSFQLRMRPSANSALSQCRSTNPWCTKKSSLFALSVLVHLQSACILA